MSSLKLPRSDDVMRIINRWRQQVEAFIPSFASETRRDINYDRGYVGINKEMPKTRLHSTGSTILGVNSSANADVDLSNGEVNIWVDETNDELEFKVKYSNGTVKSGTVSLL